MQPVRVPRVHWAAVVCGALLLAYAALGYIAATTKSPTYDEPLHTAAGYLHLHEHDFRVDPEDPPLWKYWAMLPNGRGALDPSLTRTPLFAGVADDIYHEWDFAVKMLYLTDENAARSDAIIQRGRAMMTVLAVALGALIAYWSWKLGGPIAAVAATCVFAFDPNFLGHGPLIKNDVPLSLVTLGLALAVWRAGNRMTWLNLLAIGVLCAAALTVKFSGILLGPVVAILLIYRATLKTPWFFLWRAFTALTDRLVLVGFVIAAAAIISWIGVWACYGFRFGPSPDPNVQLSVVKMVTYTAMQEMTVVNRGAMPTTQQTDAWKPGTFVRVIMALEAEHFLPQAWLLGLMFTYQSTLARQTFLMGNYSLFGWWYYFPLAMLFKTPLSTLITITSSLALAGFAFIRHRKSKQRFSDHQRWTAACLIVPPAVYLGFAMASNLNLGLRHILPVYPFIFIGIGLAVSYAWKHWPRAAKIAASILALGLAIESLTAFPNYIAFFNAPAGGSRGGIRLLGDSNLDWGQDLKLLRVWQQQHPTTNLYLVYFGLAHPMAYDLRYFNFPGSNPWAGERKVHSEPGVLAISATKLQGVYEEPQMRESFARLRELEPFEVLGGTIYLYHWPPPTKSR